MSDALTLTAVFTPDENGWTMAQLAEWPAVVTCGRTVEEARAMLLDAAREMIASYRGEGREPPIGGGHVEQLTIDVAAAWSAANSNAYLSAQGCELLREGSNHSIWHNPPEDLRTPVPRHREIPTGTARAICRQLAIPPPSGARWTAERWPQTNEQRALDRCVLSALGLDPTRLGELYTDTLRMGEVRHLLAAGRGTMRRERYAMDLDEVAKDVAAQLRPLIGGRRFPQSYVAASEPTQIIQLGNAPVRVRSELMLGQRHVKVTAAGHVIYEDHVPEATGDLIVRAIQSGQRTVEVPHSETASQAALDSLQALLSQIDFKLNQLGSTAGVQSQGPLREQAEQHLNLPVGLLLQALDAVYDGEH